MRIYATWVKASNGDALLRVRAVMRSAVQRVPTVRTALAKVGSGRRFNPGMSE